MDAREQREMSKSVIPFNRPYSTGFELANIQQAYENGMLSGDGPFSQQCETWLKSYANVEMALVTHSCTGALEMAALLLGLKPGDEIIMPSYTFVSTANAFALRGVVPVFVDIRADTLNIDENLIEAAITKKTRGICMVHYAGVACEMDVIMDIAQKYSLKVVEDAAHAIGAQYKGQPLGGIGDFGTLSFHETKNLTCGHGGALLIRDKKWTQRAEIIHQKGTDRRSFGRNEVDRYTWQDIGSSFLLGELSAAFLITQLEHMVQINEQRHALWAQYNEALKPLEVKGWIKRPTVPQGCSHNAHMYYILLNPRFNRRAVLKELLDAGIKAVFHYIPLHKAPAGQKCARQSGDLSVTNDCAKRVIRLPLWTNMPSASIDFIVDNLEKTLKFQTK